MIMEVPVSPEPALESSIHNDTITGSFLGMEVEAINADVEDAIGELANMLGGNVKTILLENGRNINLSLPRILMPSTALWSENSFLQIAIAMVKN